MLFRTQPSAIFMELKAEFFTINKPVANSPFRTQSSFKNRLRTEVVHFYVGSSNDII